MLEMIDALLRVSGRQVLDHHGSLSKIEAEQKAQLEFAKYRQLRANEAVAVEQHFETPIDSVQSIKTV